MLLILTTAISLACDSGEGCTKPDASHSPIEERADPAQFCEGTLDPEAARTAAEFRGFPILWLGEEFMGYRLTSTGDIFGGDLSLVYGSCERSRGEGSCTPPLVIINKGPISPGAGGIEPFVRGLTTGGPGLGSITMWTEGGLGIEVQSNADIRDEILQALVIANDDLFGLPEVLPGQSLDALNDWSR